MILRAISVCMILLASGCVGMTPEQLRQQTLNYVETYDRPDHVRDALLALKPIKGMNSRDIEYLYGKPRRVNRASYGTQAVYAQYCQWSRTSMQENIYIYFEGDTVTDWQIGGCIY